MEYRIMNDGDISKAVSLYIDYYNNHEDGEWTEETTSKRIRQVMSRDDSYCLVAEDNGVMTAFAMGYFEQYDDGFTYDLIEIVVAYEKQHAGIGTEFMKELEKRVKAEGAILIQLESVNDEAHERFYGKLGYKTASNLILKTKTI